MLVHPIRAIADEGERKAAEARTESLRMIAATCLLSEGGFAEVLALMDEGCLSVEHAKACLHELEDDALMAIKPGSFE